MSYVEVETGRYVKRWAFWNPATWSIPKLYWDAWSQEQRLHAICRQLEKVIKYADYLGVNVDDIAARLKAIEEGQLDDFIVSAIETWFEENEPEIVQALETLQDEIDGIVARPYQFTFENVSQMQQYDLQVGDQCETLSYRTSGDNGGNVYKIEDSGTEDGGSCIQLDNGLFAIASENLRFVEKWGADNSNLIDASDAIQACIDYNKGKSIEFQGGTFKITKPLYTFYKDDEKTDILGNSSILAVDETLAVNIEAVLCIGYKDYEVTENESGVNFNKISNITIDGNGKANYAIVINKGFKDCRIQWLETFRCKNGIRISEYQSVNPRPSDVSIMDSKIRGNGNLDFGTGLEIYGTDNKITNVNIARHSPCIDIECSSQYFHNVHGIVSFGDTAAAVANWYNTLFAIVNGNTVTFDYCYADSLHGILDIGSSVNGKIEWINSIWLRINANIGFELFKVNGNPQLIIENNYFDLPSGEKADNTKKRVGIEFENALGISRFNDDRLNISNNYCTNSNRLDYFNSDLIRCAENAQTALFSMVADNWYLIGSVVCALANPVNFRIYLLTGYIDVYMRTSGTTDNPGIISLQVDKTHAGIYPNMTIGLTPFKSPNNVTIGVLAKDTSTANQILGIAMIGPNDLGVIPSFEALGLALTPSIYDGTPIYTFSAN